MGRKVEYPDDCNRIRNIALKLGYDCSLRDASELWSEYSEDMCASWLFLPKEDEIQIIEAIRRYFGG